MEVEQQLAFAPPLCNVVQRRPGAAIPDDDVAGAVVARRDRALEVGVFHRMVFDQRGEALVGRIGGRTFRHGPRTQRAVHLEAEVEVQMTRAMLLHDEQSAGARFDRRCRTERFCGARSAPFVTISVESGARSRAFS